MSDFGFDSDPDLDNLGAQAAAPPTTTTKKKAKKVASEEKDPMEQYRVSIGGVCTCMHVCVRVWCACARARACVCVCVVYVCACHGVCACEVGLQLCIREFLVARRILDVVSVVCCLRASSYRLHQPGVFPCTTGVGGRKGEEEL
jgi:hypothetical protein